MIAQGLRTPPVESQEEAAERATAILNGYDPDDLKVFNNIGEGVCWIPPGSLLLLDPKDVQHIEETVYMRARRNYLVEKGRLSQPGARVRVLTRPLQNPDLAPPDDTFIKLLADERKSLTECARRAIPPADGPASVRDHMLLSLWDALFLDDCIR